ncbi:hypothetical protein SERLADRAFT_369015 [Serpula lacrymans var. lacrymans S7.9]|uniref:Uncharacterized protein n=1 Tax=Serpula lacrymans var. lacrymans (strain S7.9) TaxID=578457 RepID=F8NTE4_SERL9|nr:uncharacterized protein SERLADRAFT_369015 [Serpula lacrymans var. lacrymans S7.9]EGO25616.1 hypothetical protein SERLADRAFT_369015 [Serpula lacrymans var. lacrymans S7.9]
MTIRLVTFDALHTLLTPRSPIYAQYSDTFAPYIGVLNPHSLKLSFKAALKHVQSTNPVYQGDDGVRGWWTDVIRRTAVGAGADAQAVEDSLPHIVPRLLSRFSSKEGYKLFDDSLPVLRELHRMNIRTALVSNTDCRMRSVLEDLEVLPYLNPVLLSEETGVEKPAAEIFLRACKTEAVNVIDSVHVGDELDCDYHGARAANMHALLIRRPGPDGEGERKEEGENLDGVTVIDGLWGAIEWIKRKNADRTKISTTG